MGKKFMHLAGGVAALMVVVASPVFAEVTFDWATVGNPGNAADLLNSGTIPGIGSVENEYRIAKHEVTNAQYAEFLNAVAATDTNALYNAAMASDPRGGITQSGSLGSFTYAVETNMDNKPVNYVSFLDAMRFVNWLHNGQPTGAQDASTTESGVYAISDGASETRSTDAQFFIPTESEWYKAAYHQPSVDGGDADDYWLYPTVSNGAPTVATASAAGDISNPGANVANYGSGASWNGQTGNVTTVGSAGVLSESYYGTFDQGGNVFEWNETVVSSVFRIFRGGGFMDSFNQMGSSYRIVSGPLIEDRLFGFRVASPVSLVPAVSEWGLAALVLLILTAGTIVQGKRTLGKA